MQKHLLFIIFLFSFLNAAAQTQPVSNRIANYDISVKLDPEKHTLTGKETLVCTNTSTDNITELQFHLYLNAFKNKNSTTRNNI